MTDTKTRLLEAAEELFARDGVRGARVSEITQRAGQANSSALHYHYGSVDGVLLEIVRRHQDDIDRERTAYLDALPEDADPRSVVASIIQPLVAGLEDPSRRRYLRILPEVIANVAWLPDQAVLFAAPGLTRGHALLRARFTQLPDDVFHERYRSMLLFVATMLGRRAALSDTVAGEQLGREQFGQNLVDMAAGLVHGAAR